MSGKCTALANRNWLKLNARVALVLGTFKPSTQPWKQVWRLKWLGGSLALDELKAKYFSNPDIMDTHIGTRWSFMWRSIWAARWTVEKGARCWLGMEKAFGFGMTDGYLDLFFQKWLGQCLRGAHWNGWVRSLIESKVAGTSTWSEVPWCRVILSLSYSFL